MGYGIESVLAYLSDANSTGAQAMTAGTNQSFTVRATAGGSAPVTLETISTYFQDAGEFRVRSPRMHDNVNGVRCAVPTNVPARIADRGFQQTLYSQDTLTVEAFFNSAPTATHISMALMQIYYDDVPGVAGVYKTWAEIAPQIQDYLVVPVVPTSGATAGNWGSGVAINSTVDTFKANTSYALIGYEVPVAFGAWSIVGVDVGNLYVGGIGTTQEVDTRSFFFDQEQNNGKPSIPVINSQNKGTTNVQIADQTASTAYRMNLIFAQLRVPS